AGDPVDRIGGMNGGRVEYAFEAFGLEAKAEQACNMLRRGGTATVIGMIPPDQVVRLPGAALLDEKRIQGSAMGSNRFRLDVGRYVDLYLQGRLKLDELVSARIRLEDVNDGFKALQRGEGARSVVLFGRPRAGRPARKHEAQDREAAKNEQAPAADLDRCVDAAPGGRIRGRGLGAVAPARECAEDPPDADDDRQSAQYQPAEQVPTHRTGLSIVL